MITLQSDKSIRNPGDAPVLPLPFSDYAFRFQADDLIGAAPPGASITSWQGQGSDPAPNKIMNSIRPGWLGPVLETTGGPGGRPWLRFAGNHQIQHTFENVARRNQPMSFAVVCRADSFSNLNVGRLMGGTANLFHNLENRSTGYSSRAQSTTWIDSLQKPVGWVAVVGTFNGANSKLKVGSSAIITGNAGIHAFGGITLGAFAIATPEQAAALNGFKGGISTIQQFPYEFTDSEINELSDLLRASYRLT